MSPDNYEENPNIFSAVQSNPVAHIQDVQGVGTLEDYQIGMAEAVRDHERVAIAACHCVGKTFTLAKLVLWLGSSFPGCKIITTAPTWLQVEKLLWSEIRTGYARSRIPLGGTMLTTEWKLDDDWFAIGMSPKDDADSSEGQGTSSRFQGFHGKLVVIIFDEATGVPDKRWLQAEGMMTSGHVKWIAVGNPTSKRSGFYKCFQSPEWKKIYLDCFVSPNLKANGINSLADLERVVSEYKSKGDEEKIDYLKQFKIIHPQLLTAQWVIAKVAAQGIKHPLTQSKILAQFPDDDDWALITIASIESAIARGKLVEKSREVQNRSIGVDPARFGADSSVVTVIEDDVVTHRKSMHGFDTSSVSGYVIQLSNSLGYARRESITVDATGIGAGVVDQLNQAINEKRLRSNVTLKEIHFGQKCEHSDDQEYYFNLKAKMFVQLAEDVRTKLALPDDSVYLEELPTILYTYDNKGRYVIESKDDYKKRTGLGSPDNADSLAVANYGKYDVGIGMFTPDIAESVGGRTIAGGRNESNW